MVGATLNDMISTLQTKAQKMNVNITFSFNSLELSQIDPWNVRVRLTANFTLTDKGNLAFWNKTQVIDSLVPIEGFEDPLYTINTQSKVINKINRTVYSPFVSGSDTTNLSEHSTQGYYIANNDSPSFIGRMQGNSLANSYGIESLVNVQKLSLQGIIVQNKTIVDHVYFSASSPTSYRVSGTPSWFRIDSNHIAIYNATGLTF
jgi:hypothetical protein